MERFEVLQRRLLKRRKVGDIDCLLKSKKELKQVVRDANQWHYQHPHRAYFLPDIEWAVSIVGQLLSDVRHEIQDLEKEDSSSESILESNFIVPDPDLDYVVAVGPTSDSWGGALHDVLALRKALSVIGCVESVSPDALAVHGDAQPEQQLDYALNISDGRWHKENEQPVPPADDDDPLDEEFAESPVMLKVWHQFLQECATEIMVGISEMFPIVAGFVSPWY